MPREIKFRAWSHGEMIRVFSIEFENGKSYLNNGKTIYHEIGDEALANARLMQFTGLKDKNGKEIWESDIIKHRVGPDIRFITKEWLFFPVVFIEETACFKGEIKMERGEDILTWLDDAKGRDFEVVGNIYENPELLK